LDRRQGGARRAIRSRDRGACPGGEIELEAAGTGDEADDGLREVDVEIVAHDVPLCGGSGTAEQVAKKSRKILFGSGVADKSYGRKLVTA
jgi:hypothetical protein